MIRKKILIINLKRIGDVVLTIPLINTLKKLFPKYSIDLACHIPSNELINFCPNINKVWAYNSKSLNLILLKNISQQNYNYVFDLSGSSRSSLLSFFTFSSNIITHKKNIDNNYFIKFIYSDILNVSVRNFHTTDYYLELIRFFDISSQEIYKIKSKLPSKQLNISPKYNNLIKDIIKTFKINSKFIIIHPGSARKEKYWQPLKWAKVIEHIHNNNYQCVITGTKNKFELNHINEIIDHYQNLTNKQNIPLINLIGKLTISELICLTQKSQMVISVDTAISHIASLLEKKQITLFGLTNPFHWYAQHNKSITILASQKEPVREFKPKHKKKSMLHISDKTVIDRFLKLNNILNIFNE